MILNAFHEGGYLMYAILALGIATAILMVERTLVLFIRFREKPLQIRNHLLSFIQRADLDGAHSYVQTLPNQLMGKIAAGAVELRARDAGEEEIQARMDEALTTVARRIDQRTGFLAMLGNVATLLGLLGTITGMIQSFASVSAANPAERATLLSRGIAEAMNCTAFGLIVAIPALIAYAIFQSRTEKILGEITEAGTKIYHDLVFLYGSLKTRGAVALSQQE